MNKNLVMKFSFAILIPLTIVSCKNNSLDMHKNKNAIVENSTPAADSISAMTVDTAQKVERTKEPEPLDYKISNIQEYTNEKFEKSVSFTFQNTSKERMTNIMFKEKYNSKVNEKKKKSDFTNKKVNLNPQDSVKFVFKKNHYKLVVYKIRFSSGNSITLELGDAFSDLGDGRNTIYSKLSLFEDD